MAPVTRPPPLSVQTVVHHVIKYFPFRRVEEDSVKELVSYDDRNYCFRGILEGTTTGVQSFVFKVNHAEMTSDLVEGLNAIMNHVHSRGISCPVPLCSRQGSQTVALPHTDLLTWEMPPNVNQNENMFCARVLTYINGDCAVSVRMTPNLLYDIGAFVGNLDHVLSVSRIFNNAGC